MLDKIVFQNKDKSSKIATNRILIDQNINEIKTVVNSAIDYLNNFSPVISGDYLPLSGGTIEGSLNVKNDLTINSHAVNTAQGLVQLNSAGKILDSLYDKGLSGNYYPMSGGNLSGWINATNYKLNGYDLNKAYGLVKLGSDGKIPESLYKNEFLPLTGGIISGDLTVNNINSKQVFINSVSVASALTTVTIYKKLPSAVDLQIALQQHCYYQPEVLKTSYITSLNITKFANDSSIVFNTDSSSFTWNTAASVYSDFFINKPFNFEKGKSYMILVQNNVIVWTEVQ